VFATLPSSGVIEKVTVQDAAAAGMVTPNVHASASETVVHVCVCVTTALGETEGSKVTVATRPAIAEGYEKDPTPVPVEVCVIADDAVEEAPVPATVRE
jgi:hypothetical protein